jgi:hypothetical protein
MTVKGACSWFSGSCCAARAFDVHKRPAYGEGIGRLKGDPLYRVSLDAAEQAIARQSRLPCYRTR